MNFKFFHRIILFAILYTAFCSTYLSAQWIASNNGIYGGQISAMTSRGGNLFVGTFGGVYISTDNGNSWKHRSDGLDNTSINALAVTNNNKLYAAPNGSSTLFVASPPYTTWSKLNSGLPSNPIISLATIGNQVFALTNLGALYTLPDNSSLWTLLNSSELDGLKPTSLSAAENSLFIGTNQGVFISEDNGVSWQSIGSSLNEKSIYQLNSFGNFLLAVTRIGGVYLSRDNGRSWLLTTLETNKYKLYELNGVLYAGNESRVYFSTNQGDTWDQVRTLPGAVDFAVVGATFFVGNRYGIYRSFNGGQSWAINNSSNLTNSFVVGFTSSESKIFCGTGVGVYRSDNIGKTWTSIAKGLSLDRVSAIKYFKKRLFVALSNYGIYYSDNDGNSWTLSIGVLNINSFDELGGNLLAGGSDGLLLSSDEGISWSRLSGITRLKGLVVRKDTIFACSSLEGSSFSSDKGKTWSSNNSGLPLPRDNFTSIFSYGGSLFLGGDNGIPIYEQKETGTQWQPATTGLPTNRSTTSFAAQEENFFSGGGSGVFLSSEGKWSPFFEKELPIINETNRIESLGIHRNHLFAGTTGNGVWVSCFTPSRPKISVIGNGPNDSTLVSSSVVGNQWYLNDVPISGATNPSFKPTVSGNYTVKLNLDGCESLFSTVRQLVLEIYDDPVIEMPNVFTPNNDKFNPLFVPTLFENVSTAGIQIIDRWGNRVFRTDNLILGWNGGNETNGIYYYQILFQGKNGKEGKVTGWVHLVR